MSEERYSIHERLVSSAAVGALRNALNTQNMGLSESQCILIDNTVSIQIRRAVVDAMRQHLTPPNPNTTEQKGE